MTEYNQNDKKHQKQQKIPGKQTTNPAEHKTLSSQSILEWPEDMPCSDRS